MRLLAAALIFAASPLIAAPAVAGAVDNVTLSPKAQSAFHKNYGDADGAELSAYVQTRLARELARRGLAGDTRLSIQTELVAAAPTRPTWAQLGRNVALSMESVSLGGAELHAKLVDSEGAVVEEVHYKYYENDLANARAASTWTDAHNAIRRFAVKVADAYAAKVK